MTTCLVSSGGAAGWQVHSSFGSQNQPEDKGADVRQRPVSVSVSVSASVFVFVSDLLGHSTTPICQPTDLYIPS